MASALIGGQSFHPEWGVMGVHTRSLLPWWWPWGSGWPWTIFCLKDLGVLVPVYSLRCRGVGVLGWLKSSICYRVSTCRRVLPSLHGSLG